MLVFLCTYLAENADNVSSFWCLLYWWWIKLYIFWLIASEWHIQCRTLLTSSYLLLFKLLLILEHPAMLLPTGCTSITFATIVCIIIVSKVKEHPAVLLPTGTSLLLLLLVLLLLLEVLFLLEYPVMLLTTGSRSLLFPLSTSAITARTQHLGSTINQFLDLRKNCPS